MKIGIDIDGVLTIFENYKWAYQEYYDLFKINGNGLVNPFDYAYNLYNWDEKEKEVFWRDYQKCVIEDIAMQPLANYIMRKLKEDGHSIYLITSRKPYECHGKMVELTENWLRKNDIPYESLTYNIDNKLSACKKLGIDVYVEDKPENVLSVASEIPVFCFHASYNIECKGNNITRVFSWPEIYRMISLINK